MTTEIVPASTPTLFWRTQGGRMIHAHDCRVLKRTETKWEWRWAAGMDYAGILADDVIAGLRMTGSRFCRVCLPWHADMLAAEHAGAEVTCPRCLRKEASE